jgi:hypothetical protein
MGNDARRGVGSGRGQAADARQGEVTACYTCRGCGFVLVVSSVLAVRSLGWQALDEQAGTGLCANCGAAVDGSQPPVRRG